jgi:hypothetical protein
MVSQHNENRTMTGRLILAGSDVIPPHHKRKAAGSPAGPKGGLLSEKSNFLEEIQFIEYPAIRYARNSFILNKIIVNQPGTYLA